LAAVPSPPLGGRLLKWAHEKDRSADQDLPGVPAAVRLSQEMARLLGRGPVLLGALPQESWAGAVSDLQLVWFKRDLRIDDHRPLVEASRRGPMLPLYVVEPDYWQLPDASRRQQDFVAESLAELHAALARLGQGLLIETGSVVEVLARLHRDLRVQAVHAHEETGNAWTFARDRAVRAWCREHRRYKHPVLRIPEVSRAAPMRRLTPVAAHNGRNSV